MAMLSNITEWDQRRARHLLNRAGFGVSQALVEHLESLGAEEAVGYLVDYERLDQHLRAPSFLLPALKRGEVAELAMHATAEERREFVTKRNREERRALDLLKGWWLARMLHTPRPLEEKLALFWHGHFATSSQKVRSSKLTYDLNAIFRKHATGNFKELTLAVGQSPAMLDYLDNQKSDKRKPNENWARELMELFTLGKGQYSEEDIKASARAFTGWSADGDRFVYRRNRHDTGEKTFLGKTGNFDGWEIIDLLFEQPAAASFLCAKLWSFFAYEDPEPEIVETLAATMRAEHYDLKPVLRQLFLSEAFYSERAMGTQIKSPAQLLVRLCEDLNAEQPPYALMSRACAALGQDLFYPPNVKGWDGNRAWINANVLLIRYNLPAALAKAAMQVDRMEMRAQDGDKDRMDAAKESRILYNQTVTMEKELDGDAVEAPVSMREWRGQQRERAREKLAQMPRMEARAIRIQLRDASTKESLEVMTRKLGLPPPPWEKGDPARLFADLDFSTAATCVQAMQERFLVVPLDLEQRRTLCEALGAKDPEAPLSVNDLPLDKRREALHLLTSMAEYQLC